MHLGAAAGHGAAGSGAAAIARVQHDALPGRGAAPTAEKLQRNVGGLVEDGQVVVGVAGHPDQSVIGSRDPPPVTAHPAADSNSCRVVDTMTVTGSPLCWPNSPEHSN